MERSGALDRGRERTVSTEISARRFAVLFGLGLLGVIALAISTPAQLAQLPDAPEVSSVVVIVAVTVQSAVLLALAVLVGLYAAPRLGLRSRALDRVSHGSPILPAIRDELPIAVGLGVAAGVALVLAEAVLAPTPSPAPGSADATVGAVLSTVPLRFLYGGITEEILMRWGFLSLVAFGLWRTVGRGTERPSDAVMWAAIVVAAIAFGVGHLPAALTLYGELTPAVVAWIVAGNSIGGLAFGWLFWRRSLEAAMIAHVSTHVVFVAASIGLVLG